MPQVSQKLERLAAQIEALALEERLQLLRAVLTPELELKLLIDDLSSRSRDHDPRAIARDIDAAVREIRQNRLATP